MSDTEPSFKIIGFTRAEKNSPMYAKIKEHLEIRLKSLREKNDRSQTIEETERLRGRIEEIKHLLRVE